MKSSPLLVTSAMAFQRYCWTVNKIVSESRTSYLLFLDMDRGWNCTVELDGKPVSLPLLEDQQTHKMIGVLPVWSDDVNILVEDQGEIAYLASDGESPDEIVPSGTHAYRITVMLPYERE